MMIKIFKYHLPTSVQVVRRALNSAKQTLSSRRKISVGKMLLFLLILNNSIHAQVLPPAYSTGVMTNYVRTWEANAPEQNPNALMTRPITDVKQTTQYFDGLGRLIQIVAKQMSPLQKDMVNAVVYDDYGGETYKYLPFTSTQTSGGNEVTNDGLFKMNPFQQQSQFMQNQYSAQGETYFYSQINYESSPLNRVITLMAPGNSWVGSSRGVQMNYWINTSNDAIRIWTVSDVPGSFGSYTTNATYDAGQLFKNVTTDENLKQVIEFKDKDGKVILKKVQLTATTDDGTGCGYSGWLCTFYIYDDLSQLRAVLQPKAVQLLDPATGTLNWSPSTDVLNELTFRYEYDGRGRMTMKKVPGAGEVDMVYDVRDRLVMTQDANLKVQGKWMVTEYDALNRPWRTGLFTDANSQSYHQNLAGTSTSYPNTSSNYEVLTQTGYDDYSNLPTGAPSGSIDNTYINSTNFFTTYNTSPDYAQAIMQSTATKGMVTWTMTKVLGTTSTYLYSVHFYDDKGRMVQVKSTNISGGTDIATTQYDFSGKVVRSHIAHQKSGTNANTYTILTKNSYDHAGRLLTVTKRVNSSTTNNTTDKTIVQNTYDELGQLKTKKLGTDPNNTNNPLETLTYDYNIRGWMLGANRDYAKSTSSTSNWFGFDLGYDKTTIQPNGGSSIGTYTASQYNGNITGMLWKSTGDDETRKYDFTYDAVNRITSADFNQYTSSTFNKTAGIDFSVSGLTYDANGNILSMNQKGWKVGGSSYIDQLTYGYTANSNKLLTVTDASNDNTSKLGDFKYDATTKTSTDYSYDVNGNLTLDNNKKISSINYNYLNLPNNITVTAKGTITYVYDATGNKLEKITVDNTVSPSKTTTTLYMLGTYENDVLQFLPHEEGRIRPQIDVNNNITGFVYDYFLKDHLGNVRMMLTEDQKTDAYPAATMETASATTEEALYSNVNTTRVDLPSGYPTDTYTSTNYKVSKVNGSGNKIGPAIILKVMAGDQFNVRVSSWYNLNGSTPNTPVNPLTDLLSALTTSVGSISSKATATELSSSGVLSPGATQFLSDHSYTSSKPKAYLNYILLDEQFNYVISSSGFDQVGNDNTLTVLQHSGLPINKNGYLYIYVSNETPNIDVFFDNLQVTQIRGPLISEDHYYPFGLTMSGISSKALNFGSPENKFKFNGIEQNNDFDLNMYDAHYRNLDPQIGRFWQLDPKPNEMVSSYAAMLNNPIRFSDPLGDTTWLYNQNGAYLGVVNDKLKNQAHYIKTDGDPGTPININGKYAKAYGQAFRKTSIAFIGSNTMSDMKSIANHSVKEGVEIAFVGTIGKDKEIRLKELPIDESNKSNMVNSKGQIDNNYSPEEQKNLFLEGHTHISAYLDALKSPVEMKSFLKNGLPDQSPTKPDDYNAILNRGNNQPGAPSMVITPFGVTLYGTLHMTPYGQPSPNNTYLNYKSLK